MRALLGIATLCGVLACGGSDGPAAPAKGTVFFKVDALTCQGTGTIQFFLDGSNVGTETLSAGQTSQGYPTTAGSHVAGARLANSTYVWPNTTIQVTANGSYTDILPCS